MSAILLILILFIPLKVNAQVGSSGVAISVPLPGENPDASIVCSDGTGYRLCDEEYSSSMVGVIVDDPAVAFEGASIENARPVVSSGSVVVRVSAINGNIARGDLISSTSTPGVGAKATINGFILGTALEDFSPPNPDQEGLVLVSVNIHPTLELSDGRTSVLQNLRQGLSFPFLSPMASLRYLLAFAIVVIGFIFGFLHFGRIAKTGVEALGRNPLASSSIRFGIVFNVMLGIVVLLISLALAGLVLVL